MPRPQKKPSTRPNRPARTESRDEISREAFKIYQARHGAPGDPAADWFEAERAVMARNSKQGPRAAQAEASAGASGRRSNRRRK